MSLETVARQSLYRQTHARGGDLHSLADRRLLRRIWRFAGRHHRRLAVFLAVSVGAAGLTVATPLLAGRVVDEITGAGSSAMVTTLAAVIAAVAVAEAVVSLGTRWLSSVIGEGLILDLRTAVFDHVQRMPVAFFTRTRTGALVSRLGNDVMGAQRAFSDTLSGVVTNIVTLTLTLVVMLRISWQITLLSLVLMPLFVIPARRIGSASGPAVARVGRSQRDDEHPDDRAVLGARRDAGQTVRRHRRRVPRVRRARRASARHRGAHRDAASDVHELADADVGTGPGLGVRAGRGVGDRWASAGRRDRVAGPVADPAVCAADRAGQCTS